MTLRNIGVRFSMDLCIPSWSLKYYGPEPWIRLGHRCELQVGAVSWISWAYYLVCLVLEEHSNLQWGITTLPHGY